MEEVKLFLVDRMERAICSLFLCDVTENRRGVKQKGDKVKWQKFQKEKLVPFIWHASKLFSVMEKDEKLWERDQFFPYPRLLAVCL